MNKFKPALLAKGLPLNRVVGLDGRDRCRRYTAGQVLCLRAPQGRLRESALMADHIEAKAPNRSRAHWYIYKLDNVAADPSVA